MVELFRIKNWNIHQHYKDRRPPWIKLHNALFDDYEFQVLSDASKLHLIAIWLLASRSTKVNEDNEPLLPCDEKYLTKQAGLKSPIRLKPLISLGFVIIASKSLAGCKRVAILETETETETEKRQRFVQPTLDDVRAYCIERKNSVDPERFIDHYQSNGWKVGKNSMKDWKAAVRTWEKNEQEKSTPKSKLHTGPVGDLLRAEGFIK